MAGITDNKDMENSVSFFDAFSLRKATIASNFATMNMNEQIALK